MTGHLDGSLISGERGLALTSLTVYALSLGVGFRVWLFGPWTQSPIF